MSERFWRKVRKGEGCWEWTGARNSKGYGNVRIARRYRGAHRVSYELTRGPIPAGLLVCHSCDNPVCVRPDHLFLGTVKNNSDDMVRKGRQAKGEKIGAHLRGLRNGKYTKPERTPRGERNGQAVLTAERVAEIRHRYAAGGVTQLQLAAEYGVNDRCISAVINHQTWKHVS
jgi:hypothetical protein